MKLFHALLAALLAFSLCGNTAQAAEPEERYLLTPALLQKMKAAGPELKKLEKEDDEDEADNLSSADYIRFIESQPRAKAVLAKHGIAVKDFALGTYALMHAGVFVTMESMMGKKQAAEQMAEFTSEQKANIALLRKLGPAAYQSK